ncbi:hypothetical protein NDU88_002852 [Pleurodeles waltl]|uniref:Uncharacterized protein n=1 Tax=Pleurodeles waltl TaxID=8319 RepID=A0AAV7NF07_PLEWA|nr:hypothetical protein NDU88_002850 [Pleurodeles waltl]KAJ1114617.1 hypothetical protein NDU88_002852 [Pleurodeles waltl]
MCRQDLANAAPPDRKCGEPTSARQILSPGAFWRRAALELRRSRGSLLRPPYGEKQAGAEPAQVKAG